MSVIEASSRFGKRATAKTENRITIVRIVESCPACNSMNFNVVIELSKEMPTLRCSNPICDWKAGDFQFMEIIE